MLREKLKGGSAWKRGLSALLCTLLLPAMPMLAKAEFAVDSGSGPVTAKIEMTVEGAGEEPGELPDVSGSILDSSVYESPANAAVEFSMYSRIGTRQRSCYKALEDISIDTITTAPLQGGFRMVECPITGITNSTLNGRISSGGQFIPGDAAAKAAYDSLLNDMGAAVVALRYDRPDLLWLDGSVFYTVYMSWYPGTSRVTVTRALYGFPLIYGGREKAMRTQMMQAAQQIADKAAAEPDVYSRLKAAHNALGNQATYNHAPKNQLEDYLRHSAYSTLIAGDAYEPVCDGYSKAMKLVCDLMGIPCVCVSSATHMWNNVKMDDGLWYNLDLTWDDGLTSSVVDTYFLVGSQTTTQGAPFETQASHVELSPFQEDGITVPSKQIYPTKSKNAYKYLGENYPPLRFSDVTRADWYYETVENAAELGYFKGDEYGKFLPTKNITRAEFASVMANVQGVDLSGYQGNAGFRDVSPSAWYAKAVAWAKDSGLMQGSGARFRPGDPITRQEICLVLYNFHEDLQSFTSGYFMFDDDVDIANWAWKAVYACNAAGLVQGDGKGGFNPLKNAMRCEAATILSRLNELG